MNTYLLIYIILSWLAGFFFWKDTFENAKKLHMGAIYSSYFILVLFTPVFIPIRLIVKLIK
jgi:hypothetical protein